jgi:hypothetical protein
MQDQQKQTRDQHNGSYSCYRENQCLHRRVVTYTLALHGQNPIQKSLLPLRDERQALKADYRMQFDECHSSEWL